MTGPQVFFAAEVDVYQPASGTLTFDLPSGTHPAGTLAMLPNMLASSDTLRVSDQGYRTRAADAGGLQVYPALLDQAFDIDRHVSLEPGQASTATLGSLRLINLGRRFDAYVASRNVDSRSVRLLRGSKAFDASRGIHVDPAYASLVPFFGGSASSWQLSEDALEIQLRDASYWATRPLQSNFYLGTGGYNGGSDLAGKPVPIVRGGTANYPVQNVPLVLVDAVNLIYQYTDGFGTVSSLYEGGASVFGYDGDVADLYAGTPPISGRFRTCNARGMVQLGAKPFGNRAITADVVGYFPSAGLIATPGALAYYLLTETMGLPASLINLASFSAADTAYHYTAGIAADTDPVQGLDVVQLCLGSIGARLISARTGVLQAFVLRAVPAGATPVLTLSPQNAYRVTPVALPSVLDPPPYRWRVGYGHNYTPGTSNLNGSLSDDRKKALANSDQFATWSGTGVLTAFRRPNDPSPVITALLVQSEAQALANDLGAQWQGLPGLYSVEMPIELATALDIGSVVSLTWPLRNLNGGLGQIVGEQVRSGEATVTFQVLVG